LVKVQRRTQRLYGRIPAYLNGSLRAIDTSQAMMNYYRKAGLSEDEAEARFASKKNLF